MGARDRPHCHDRLRLHALTALALWSVVAWAADVTIRATVADDLRSVRGTITWVTPPDTVVDPLAAVPDPVDDLFSLRTFPGAASRGRVEWTPDGTFLATLPRRFGDLGTTAHGLFANGGWYPQARTERGLETQNWQVTLTLPPGITGAVGDTVGSGTLHWEGAGERASIAAVRRGRVTALSAETHHISLLTQGAPRRWLVRELQDQLALLPDPLSGVAVQAPLRRRLTRHGPGLAYVSDRAFRLTAGTRFAHRKAVTRGVVTAWVAPADHLHRELAAAALGALHAERAAGLDTDRLLGAFRWVPQVNALLSSQRTPFFAEILGRVHPGDPVADDLTEVHAPHTPGAAVYAQLDDRYGDGTGRCVGGGLLAADPVTVVLAACGLAPDALDGWRARPTTQDYALTVHRDRVTVDRQVAATAAAEAVVVRIDGEDHTVLAPPGRTDIPASDPRTVVIDPARHTAQTSRRGDAWPPRYDVTLSGWISAINIRRLQIFGSGTATLRRLGDTKNVGIGTIAHSRADLVSVHAGYVRSAGQLLDGWRRPHRLRVGVGTGILDPAFAATDGLALALDGSAGWAHDTRISGDFPLRGHRVSVSAGGGGIPASGATWSAVSADAIGVVSPHPRVALALRAAAAAARSAVPHRLLTLGGPRAMRSIPSLPACPAIADDGTPIPCTELATERTVGMVEIRTAPVRGWSIPLLLAWGTELQLTGGFEATAARVGGDPVWATGVTAGLLGLGDLLGAEASAVGVTAAWPVAWHPRLVELRRTAVPEIYLRFEQAF